MLAVDDTPDSVAAARVAVELVAALRPTLRIVHVSTDHNLDAAVLEAGGQPAVAARRAEADAAIVARAATLATAAGVDAQTELLTGDIGPAVLDAARQWPANLVVLGKSARSATGEPYLAGKRPDDLLFTSPDGEVMRNRNARRAWFNRAATETGVARLTPHELRHTAASLAVKAGANVKALQRMLGHASAAITLDIYADLFDDDLDAVGGSLDALRRDSLVAPLRPELSLADLQSKT